MSWLVGYVVASVVAAFVVVRIFDYVFSGLAGKVADITRAGIFVGTWTAVTTGSGMRELSKRVRQLRQVIKL